MHESYVTLHSTHSSPWFERTAILKEIALSKDMLYCTVLPFIHQKIWYAMNIISGIFIAYI